MKKLILFFLFSFFALTQMAKATTTWYSISSSAPQTTTNWALNRNGTGGSPGGFAAGDIFVIQGSGNGGTSPHTMTTGAVWSVSGTGSKIQIENGAVLVATSAITVAAATTFQIDNGGTYTHSNSAAFGTTIMQGTEAFGSSSTVIFTD